MPSRVLTSLCSRCAFTLRKHLSVNPQLKASSTSCTGVRYASAKAQFQRPGRMVLADNVQSPPPTRKRRAPREESVAGPFGGMNRRVANIDRRRKPVGSPRDREKREAKRTGRREQRGTEMKALKMQRALASISYGRRNIIKERVQRFDQFSQFDLIPTLQTAVRDELFRELIDISPTPVQSLAIPFLLGQPGPDEARQPSDKMQSFLLAAETGSGKTLAYLLPAINALKLAEAEDLEIKAYNERQAAEKARQESAQGKKFKPFDEPHPTMARPKVIVLVPTAELAHQVSRISKTLSHVAKFKTEMLSSDLKPIQIQRNLYGNKGLDLVISTPHLLSSIADSDPNILSRTTHLIIDEADSLFDRSFMPVTSKIIERTMPSLKQLICCSATIPRHLNHFLATSYPDMVRITTPNLHAIPRRVQLGVIDVSRDIYRNNKDLACADIIYSIGRDASRTEPAAGPNGEVNVKRILVFVNEREKTEEVAEYLRSKGIDAEALNRDTTEKRHSEVLGNFTTTAVLKVVPPPRKQGSRSVPNVKVLVVTDLASRGIDTVPVKFVILYDVPHTTIDFIHRLGRAGRMGRRGRGIALVGNDDRKNVVAEVKKCMHLGTALI